MKYVSNQVYVLEEPAGYQEISESDFRRIVQEEGQPAIVTFTGDWMGSSTMLFLLMEDLWTEFRDKLHFFYINLEKNALTNEFGILTTATVFFFCRGEIRDQQVGLIAKSKMRSKIEQFIQSIDK